MDYEGLYSKMNPGLMGYLVWVLIWDNFKMNGL